MVPTSHGFASMKVGKFHAGVADLAVLLSPLHAQDTGTSISIPINNSTAAISAEQ